MAETFERVARPSSVLDGAGVTPPSRGMNRSHLTLLLTIVGVLCAAAGAGLATWLGVYRWNGGEQQKTINDAQKALAEAGKARLDSDINALFAEYNSNPASHPRLTAALEEFRRDPQYSPPIGSLSFHERLAFNEAARREAERMKLGAETKAALQDVEKKKAETRESHERTRIATADAIGKEEIFLPLLPVLKRAAMGAATGDANLLGVPPSSFNPPPIARGLPASLPGRLSNTTQQRSGWDSNPIGGDPDPFRQRGPIK